CASANTDAGFPAIDSLANPRRTRLQNPLTCIIAGSRRICDGWATKRKSMKPIEKSELYEHVTGFLKSKGVELKSGSYASGIQAGCSLLADAINLSQQGLSRAKVELDEKLDRVRQAIHEKTAPKTAPRSAKPANSTSAKPKARAQKPKKAKRA